MFLVQAFTLHRLETDFVVVVRVTVALFNFVSIRGFDFLFSAVFISSPLSIFFRLCLPNFVAASGISPSRTRSPFSQPHGPNFILESSQSVHVRAQTSLASPVSSICLSDPCLSPPPATNGGAIHGDAFSHWQPEALQFSPIQFPPSSSAHPPSPSPVRGQVLRVRFATQPEPQPETLRISPSKSDDHASTPSPRAATHSQWHRDAAAGSPSLRPPAWPGLRESARAVATSGLEPHKSKVRTPAWTTIERHCHFLVPVFSTSPNKFLQVSLKSSCVCQCHDDSEKTN